MNWLEIIWQGGNWRLPLDAVVEIRTPSGLTIKAPLALAFRVAAEELNK